MRSYAALQPHQLVAGRPPSMLDGAGKGVSLLAIARQHLRGTPPPRPFDEGLMRNLYVFFLAPKPYPYRWAEERSSFHSQLLVNRDRGGWSCDSLGVRVSVVVVPGGCQPRGLLVRPASSGGQLDGQGWATGRHGGVGWGRLGFCTAGVTILAQTASAT